MCYYLIFSLGWSKIQPGYVWTARISTGTSTAVQFTYCNTCEYWVVFYLHTANTFQFGTSTSIYTATQDSNSGNAKCMHHNTVWLILLSNPLFHVAMETADGSITYMECHIDLCIHRGYSNIWHFIQLSWLWLTHLTQFAVHFRIVHTIAWNIAPVKRSLLYYFSLEEVGWCQHNNSNSLHACDLGQVVWVVILWYSHQYSLLDLVLQLCINPAQTFRYLCWV